MPTFDSNMKAVNAQIERDQGTPNDERIAAALLCGCEICDTCEGLGTRETEEGEPLDCIICDTTGWQYVCPACKAITEETK